MVEPFPDEPARAPAMSERVTHELKCWPQFFEKIVANKKRFELRRLDRPFKVGDTLHLVEYDPAKGYTGRTVRRRVLYMLTHDDVGAFAADSIGPSWCIMSLGWLHDE